LCRQKGQDVLLDAWRMVARVLPDAQLVLVGDGPDRFDLEGQADPFVRFEGHSNAPHEWLAAADVVAVPSRWEGMPYSLLEAMASGRSVVATDVDGITEAAGGVAAIVPAEDAEALAEALLARLHDPDLADKEGRLARERVELAHDAAIQLALVTDLARQLVAARQSASTGSSSYSFSSS
jgi:glycosyltransferase involved in cell wall biosynthesis